MFKLFKKIKKKLSDLFGHKALLEKIGELEARLAKLESQNKKLKKTVKELTAATKALEDNTAKALEAAAASKPAPAQQSTAGKSTKDIRIQSIMEKTGWSRETTIANVEAARKHIGITYTKYDKYDFHKVPAEKQAEQYLTVLTEEKVKGKKARKERKNEKLLMTVIVNTGWDYEQAKAAMEKSRVISGAEYKDYVAYRFWELPDEVQKTYFTKGDANALRKKYNTNKDNLRFFMNKNEFNEKFEKFLGRPWAHTAQMTLESFTNTFANETRIIYKPLSDSCGHGVTVFDLNSEVMESVYENLKALPEGVVEGYVVQHPEMSKYSRKSVNTVRLVSVRAFNKINVLYAAFRMGGGDAVVDNFHAGGVLALIDVNTGKLATEAIDLAGKFYEYHPVTNEKIVGFQIPYWSEVVKLIEEAGHVVEGVGYVGWDIAITENGPILIEGNTAPAPNVLQTPYARYHQGMKHVVAKYL